MAIIIDDPRMARLFNSWDRLDAACKSISCAQPFQMTKAAGELYEARVEMGDAIRALIFSTTQNQEAE